MIRTGLVTIAFVIARRILAVSLMRRNGTVLEIPKGSHGGRVTLGEQPQRGDDPRAMIEVTRPLASSNDQDDGFFSANMVYKRDTSPKFEVDTRRAYAGVARSKAGIFPGDLDFAVHRSVHRVA